MFRDLTVAPDARTMCRARTEDAEEVILVLAEHTAPDAPEAVRHALATLAAHLNVPDVDVIRAGLVGWDAEDGLAPDLIAWSTAA